MCPSSWKLYVDDFPFFSSSLACLEPELELFEVWEINVRQIIIIANGINSQTPKLQTALARVLDELERNQKKENHLQTNSKMMGTLARQKWPKCIPSSPMMIVNAKKDISGGSKFLTFFFHLECPCMYLVGRMLKKSKFCTFGSRVKAGTPWALLNAWCPSNTAFSNPCAP